MSTEPVDIDVQAAMKLLDDGAVLLDVREDDEWDAGHAPAALHIRLSEVPDRFSSLPSDRPIVCVCRAGGRSARAAAFLAQQDFATFNIEGGMNAWALAGEAVITDGGAPGNVI